MAVTKPEDCFLAGTLIATARGEIAVQNLRPGDHATLHDNRTAPVTWIGRRYIDCRLHPEPRKVWPVRVRAGAFGDDVPRRDLFLSPDHAVFAGNVLIPIKHLINGTTIEQVPIDDVTYFHIELPRHDLLLAEGLLAESYLDTGDRSNFTNGGWPVVWHPDFSARTWAAKGCAPLVIVGSEIATVRQKLADRARLVCPDSRDATGARRKRPETVEAMAARLPRRAAGLDSWSSS
jgi:collagen type I/II/III/V/XI/XXIV/XXVII alpha